MSDSSVVGGVDGRVSTGGGPVVGVGDVITARGADAGGGLECDVNTGGELVSLIPTC